MTKPFKGTYFYEWQVGPWVLQWRHVPYVIDCTVRWRLGRFQAWKDVMWALRR